MLCVFCLFFFRAFANGGPRFVAGLVLRVGGPGRHQVLIALRGWPVWEHQVGRTRLRRFSAAPTDSRRGGDTAPSYDSSVRRRTPRVHRDRRGTRTVVEGRASIVTSPGGTAAPGSWIHHVGVLNADRVLVRRRRASKETRRRRGGDAAAPQEETRRRRGCDAAAPQKRRDGAAGDCVGRSFRLYCLDMPRLMYAIRDEGIFYMVNSRK